MEEVVSSNLTRSTKTFHRLSVSRRLQNYPTESNRSPNLDASPGIRESLEKVTPFSRDLSPPWKIRHFRQTGAKLLIWLA